MYVDCAALYEWLKLKLEETMNTEAFLVIDYINDIVDPGGALAEFGTPNHVIKQNAIANTKRALEHARLKKSKIVFIKVAFKPGHLELAHTKAPFYLAHVNNNWLVEGTWGTHFTPELQPNEGEIVIVKRRVNPFTNPELLRQLRGFDRLVVCGVATNFAVEETVRNAAALDFAVTVLEDCCASNNATLHEFAITNIFPKFATISSSQDYVESRQQ